VGCPFLHKTKVKHAHVRFRMQLIPLPNGPWTTETAKLWGGAVEHGLWAQTSCPASLRAAHYADAPHRGRVGVGQRVGCGSQEVKNAAAVEFPFVLEGCDEKEDGRGWVRVGNTGR